MKNVYFKSITDFSDTAAINDATFKMLETLKRDEQFKLPKKMPLKVHFGEKGNTTFIAPENFEGAKKFLKSHDTETCYIETNVLYKGSRTDTADHIRTAKEHGFTDLPIVIADGEIDSPYNEIEINKKHFASCKIGKKFADYDGFLVMSHFKGHSNAGFGAAVKQLGMGFASRGGKLHQHSDNIPIISETKCISCGACVQKCPTNAIKLPNHAVIDPKLCIGCASCSTVCPVTAITNDWAGSNFLEKLAEYAYAATIGKQNIYVTFAGSITADCDCCGRKMPVIAKDIGILVSTDSVAIDTAALDLLDLAEHKKMFTRGRETLKYAESLGLGSTKYNLIKI